jgi:5-methyltetrahydropteroyltriglutamate--homocysteine methyltransferase
MSEMMQKSVVGFPRLGPGRELKKWVEGYFNGKLTQAELVANAAGLKQRQWRLQADKGIDLIPSNDFTFYDTFLDTASLLNVIPKRYHELGLDEVDTCFAMARGYQDQYHDVRALPMKKWFTTNYHYIVPTIEPDTQFQLNSRKIFTEYREALQDGVRTKPVIIGPFTFLKLATVERKTYPEWISAIVPVYREILAQLNDLDVEWLQIDEPVLVTDLAPEEVRCFETIYRQLLPEKKRVRVLLQTYFGDLRDVYETVTALDFDGIGLDFVEGPRNLELLDAKGFPAGKLLFAGVVNAKNIWINHYHRTLELLDRIARNARPDRIVLSTSCSLLHVPYTVANETRLESRHRQHLAFATEKLDELTILARLWADGDYAGSAPVRENEAIIASKKAESSFTSTEVRDRVNRLTESDFLRQPAFDQRAAIQSETLNLPLLPTTTIGSFPQTPEIRRLRQKHLNAEIDAEQYQTALRAKIAELVRLQEDLGLDVLVHGEVERNDMVEYFGQHLSGFLFTQNGWVQSYGTRAVKPPVIFGDIQRTEPITVPYITYAQSLTKKPVKGMLTGPVTILNWSFPREDLSAREIAFQLGLAIKAEVLDLEANGIRIIQIDEAALREKLPPRKADWHSAYLDWAVKAFRLVHAAVRPETQIHTHMCYSEFTDIIAEIEALDADVITFEAAKSNLEILDALQAKRFRTAVGPGVYDIHSPRIPGQAELEEILHKFLAKIPREKIWVNPDCGLKTRGMAETIPSLRNMVAAAVAVRERSAQVGKGTHV